MISKQRNRKRVGSPERARAIPLAPNGVKSRDWEAVRRYLKKHPDLRPLLPEACDRIREDFGAEAELALDEYRDPEIDDQFLTITIGLSNYDDHTMDRIERINQSFEGRIKPSKGYLLITTDFRSPG